MTGLVRGLLPVAAVLLSLPQSNRPAPPQLRRASVAAREYVAIPLRGFDVRAVPALLEGGDQSEVGARALDALDRDLGNLLDALPNTAHEFLQSVPIFLGVADPVAPCACYHVSPEWLRSNRFDPAKAKAVEIASALTYLEWRKGQPSMVMHELSHAYHDQVLGKPHRELRAALQHVRESGRLDRVVRFHGNFDSHYALTNEDEYFAETTEALFGINDFFPFVRGELLAVDPEGARLVADLWKAPAPRMADELLALESTAEKEIARLHDFFVGWFNGALPETDDGFSGVEDALASSFTMVTPDGNLLQRESLMERLRASHGKRAVAIETKLRSVQVLDGMRLFAVYDEISREDGATRVLTSTVLFERDAAAPLGLRWLHVHETAASR
ncbi:MAG: hypothetical protein AAGG01_03830 [Planctomycetota bacterium]